MLHKKKRIDLPMPFAPWIKAATTAEMLTILPLNAETVIELDEMHDGFHGDAADRMIVATARTYELPLATHDRAIRKSRLVKRWKP